jgi:hypothetical protein
MICWLRIASCLSVVAVSLTFVALPGCKKPNDNSGKPKEKEKKENAKDEHPEAGPHGGPLAEWGKDEYHGELVIDHDAKMVIVYILDGTAKNAPKIDHEKITDVKVSVVGAKPEISVMLKHDPKKSDDKGIAFVGTDDVFAKKEEAKFKLDWKVKGKDGGDEVTYSPKKKKTAALSLTPGGIYTEADIKANGGVTPKEKYAGLTHAEGKPKDGDKICPYSQEKANPECVWVIQGQTYEFCCPPCIDQFLKRAHNEPSKVKDAKEYVFHAK